MILVLLILPILTVTANPFHKYPYVFLLDVGNEELEKVNTEQIRLSSPGGSLALRYPAIGNGDDIAHVRVSGIDFGTDLKANIVDGGPGYKYVVIVLMGNTGVAYDAVLTIQTVPNVTNDDSSQNVDQNLSGKNEEGYNAYEVSVEDENNSAEDLNDSVESENTSQVGVNNKNSELSLESSNVYSYAQNEALSGYGIEYNSKEHSEADDDDDSNENDEIQAGVYEPEENSEQNENSEIEDTNIDHSRISQPNAERFTSDDDYSQVDDQPIIVDRNLYEKYEALKDHLYSGVEVYPQDSSDPGVDQNDYKPIDSIEEYNDYEDNDYKIDRNNNFIDRSDTSAVEY